MIDKTGHDAGLIADLVQMTVTPADCRLRNLSDERKDRGDCQQDCSEDGHCDTYLVRVAHVAGTASSFIWEICRDDGRVVRSTKSFRTQTEALFDSTPTAARLALGTGDGSPFLEPT